MGKMGKCCCDPCPEISELPDWEIDGFTNGDWYQYGQCCWARQYTRENLAEGIQTHYQDLFKRNFNGTFQREFEGWWVRQGWTPNGPPPVGSLYVDPVPNTCWNSYGVICTHTYTTEIENKGRQVVNFQITEVFVTVKQVYNTCTEETEYYVNVTTTIRSSNQVQTINYQRNTLTETIDSCYETPFIDPYDYSTGSLTYPSLAPVWTGIFYAVTLHKYASLAALPSTLTVDTADSPIDTIDLECFEDNLCNPFVPNAAPFCHSPPTHTVPPAFIFNPSLVPTVDACILSQIINDPQEWDLCDGPEMIVRYCTNACKTHPEAGCGTSGFGFGTSSVTSCPTLTTHELLSPPGDNVAIVTNDDRVRRKASCSPLDLIACTAYTPWFNGGKTYPVTKDELLPSHTKSRDVYSTSPVCMNPTTFVLQEPGSGIGSMAIGSTFEVS